MENGRGAHRVSDAAADDCTVVSPWAAVRDAFARGAGTLTGCSGRPAQCEACPFRGLDRCWGGTVVPPRGSGQRAPVLGRDALTDPALDGLAGRRTRVGLALGADRTASICHPCWRQNLGVNSSVAVALRLSHLTGSWAGSGCSRPSLVFRPWARLSIARHCGLTTRACGSGSPRR